TQDFRGAASYVASAAGPDDGLVVCPDWDWNPFGLYAEQHPPAEVPTPLNAIWPWTQKLPRGSASIGAHPESDAVNGSIWVVYRAASVKDAERRNHCGMDRLLEQRVRRERRHFDQVTVERWVPNG